MQRWKSGCLGLLIVLATGCAEADVSEGDMGMDEDVEDMGSEVPGDEPLVGKALVTDNGMSTINGMQVKNGVYAKNGLCALNGLSTSNGLSIVNGVSVINGMLTKNGVAISNGLPDGLLSNTTGLLSKEKNSGDVGSSGIKTAEYLVKCALPAGKSISVKDWNNTVRTFAGAVGIAPNWDTTTCSAKCQERVSACLIALTNGSGKHIKVELTGAYTEIGRGHSFKYQELVAYGNVFISPPVAFFAHGKDYPREKAMGRMASWVSGQYCSGCRNTQAQCQAGTTKYQSAPYIHTGAAFGTANTYNCDWVTTGYTLQRESGRCTGDFDVASSCTGVEGQGTWENPVTVWRDVPPT